MKNDFKTKIFIPSLDVIINEMNNNVLQTNDPILKSIECFSPLSDHFLSYSKVEPAAIHYNADLDLLATELKLIPKTIELYEKEKKSKSKVDHDVLRFFRNLQKHILTNL